MILYSRNLIKSGIPISENAVIRINIAWVKDEKELISAINDLDYDIFIDYPYKRTKPPIDVLSIGKVIEIIKSKEKVKYFAISKAEDLEYMQILRRIVPDRIKIVPKIESVKGVEKFIPIMAEACSDIAMLDTEDLYLSTNSNNAKFLECKSTFKEMGELFDIKILNLQGVVFSDDIMDNG